MTKLRISSSKIDTLKDNEIFVFGSNLSGIHGGGAAAIANALFGAEMGVGVGRRGQSYAIPTKSQSIKYALKINVIKGFVEDFLLYTKNYPQYNFLVTEIGCGLAGYNVSEIAPLFKEALKLKNVYLPLTFINHLKLTNGRTKQIG